MHYAALGCFEGPLGAKPTVDERRYIQAYANVSQAIKAGDIGSAMEHYHIAGAGEGRSPGPAQLALPGPRKKVRAAS